MQASKYNRLCTNKILVLNNKMEKVDRMSRGRGLNQMVAIV